MVVQRNFTSAFLNGILIAFALAVGLYTMAVFPFLLSDESGLFLALFSAAAVFVMLAVTPITGALIGLAAGRGASSRGQGAGAGALAGIVGLFVIVLAAFLASATIAALEDESDEGSIFEDEDSDLAWSDLGYAMLLLVPGTLAAVIAGMAVSDPGRAQRTAPAPIPYESYAAPIEPMPDAPAPDAPLPDEPMPEAPTVSSRRVSCPRCKTAFSGVPGTRITCPNCGTSGNLPA